MKKAKTIGDLLVMKTSIIVNRKNKLKKVEVTDKFKKYLKKYYSLESSEINSFLVILEHNDGNMSIVPEGREDIKLINIMASNIIEKKKVA